MTILLKTRDLAKKPSKLIYVNFKQWKILLIDYIVGSFSEFSDYITWYQIVLARDTITTLHLISALQCTAWDMLPYKKENPYICAT